MKVKKKAATTPRPRLPGMVEMLKRADLVYQGALEVIRRNGVVRSPEPDAQVIAPAYKKGAGRVKVAPAVPEIVEFVKAKGATVKPTALIRAVASSFPAASVAEIRASLPDLNPSTIGIQVSKARRG